MRACGPDFAFLVIATELQRVRIRNFHVHAGWWPQAALDESQQSHGQAPYDGLGEGTPQHAHL